MDFKVVGLMGAEWDTVECHLPAMKVAGDAEITGRHLICAKVITCAERELPFRCQREIPVDTDILIHSPFLLRTGIRESIIDIQAPRNVEIRVGVEESSSERFLAFLPLLLVLFGIVRREVESRGEIHSGQTPNSPGVFLDPLP